jgi:hypothetical protein
MQDDALDKIIQDAAAQYHPAYNDKAWQDMHALLDNNLPQKDKDRKWAWLLLPLLVTAIAAGVVWLRQPAATPLPADVAKNTNGNSRPIPAAPVSETASKMDETNNQPGNIVTQPGSPAPANGNAINSSGIMPITTALLPAPAAPGNVSANRFAASRGRARASIKAGEVDDQNNLDRATPPPPIVPATDAGGTTADKEPAVVTTAKTAVPVVVQSKPVDTVKTAPPASKTAAAPEKEKLPGDEKNTTAAQPDKKTKKRSSFANNFAVTLSAGPDYSFVKTSQPGETQLAYGAGIAYTFGKHFTVRAGVYAAKKVYITDTGSYHPKVPLPVLYKIEKIKGDCMVYEVPISLSYNFGGRKKHNWFGGAGISSVFMKRETYNYYYHLYGTPVSKSYTINNQNNHLFGTLTLSAGYQYKLTRSISLAAEPYYKVSLNGIGYGSLKLRSTGVLFSAIVQPFQKRK